MYLLHLTVIALAISSGCGFSSCNRANWNHAKHMFNFLSNLVINHDHDMKETCKHFKQFASREVFGPNAFRLEVTCPEFHSATWDVKIKHRVIYINGHYPQAGKTCDLTYVDIRVLPDFADTHDASWTIKDGTFMVALPYKYPLDARQMSCSRDIDETLLHVRRGYPTDEIFYGA